MDSGEAGLTSEANDISAVHGKFASASHVVWDESIYTR